MARALLGSLVTTRAVTLLTVVLSFLPGQAHAQESSMQRAIRLTREGQLVAALEAVDSTRDELERAQARLFVLHHAGVLDEALEAGLRGLALSPDDPWLLERCTFIAVSLGLGELAMEKAKQLQAVLTPAEWAKVSWMKDEAAILKALREQERAALERAQLVVGALALVAVGALALSSRSAPAPPEP